MVIDIDVLLSKNRCFRSKCLKERGRKEGRKGEKAHKATKFKDILASFLSP